MHHRACPIIRYRTRHAPLIQRTVVMVAQSESTTVQRKMSTKTYRYTDARGRAWTYEGDIIEAQNGGLGDAVIVCLHNAGGVGVTRKYWDRMFDMVSRENNLARYSIASFDWVGTGVSSPKRDFLEKAYDVDYFAGQLAHFVGRLGSPVVLVSQGGSEPVAIRFASQSPSALRFLVIATGLSSGSVTKRPSDFKRSVAYNILRGPLGLQFWRFVRNDWFLSGFSQKNLLVGRDHLDKWVSDTTDGSLDDRVRFALFSFASGYFFDDYTEEYKRINVPSAFFCGPEKTNRSIKNRVQSTRFPVPFLASEELFHDEKTERLDLRCKLIPNCKGVVVSGAGPEMFFEHVELAVPRLEECLQEWSKNNS